MSKKGEDRRQQQEFLFVIRGDAEQSKSKSMSEDRPNCSGEITEDVAKTHRDKLLAELREFGC